MAPSTANVGTASSHGTIDVGTHVDPDKVKATFNKGVLTITLDKRPEAQTQVKRIAINREG